LRDDVCRLLLAACCNISNKPHNLSLPANFLITNENIYFSIKDEEDEEEAAKWLMAIMKINNFQIRKNKKFSLLWIV